MSANLTQPFAESCCDGGFVSNAKSAQPCGCDEGAGWQCALHKTVYPIAIGPQEPCGHGWHFGAKCDEPKTEGLNASKSKASYIHTFTGKWIEPFEPKIEDICIEDIAHALALQCRFTGHCKFPWTVAQHSLLVMQLLRDAGATTDVQKWGLMHDASEAYLIDVARPVKHLEAFWAYRMAETALMKAICQKFEMAEEQPPLVHWADEQALSIEAHALMHDVSDWNLEKPLTGYKISEDTNWRTTEWRFKVAYWDVMNG